MDQTLVHNYNVFELHGQIHWLNDTYGYGYDNNQIIVLCNLLLYKVSTRIISVV